MLSVHLLYGFKYSYLVEIFFQQLKNWLKAENIFPRIFILYVEELNK